MNTIDNFDIQILRQMDKDGRVAYSAIAAALGISNTMVHQRVARLIEQRILIGIKAIVDEKRLDYDWGAFVGLKVENGYDPEEVISKLEDIPEITECYYVSGVTTLQIKISARNHQHLQKLFRQINNIQAIAIVHTIIELGCIFKRNVIIRSIGSPDDLAII